MTPLLLALLLLASGWFSGAETALFNLDRGDAAGKRAARLLDQPRELLLTILLGNLVVNLLFFTLAATIEVPGIAPLLVGVLALLAILLFGEILPKLLALRAGPALARFLAPPLVVLVRLSSPLRGLLGLLLDGFLRAVGAGERPSPRIDTGHLDEALQRSAQKGHIAPGEADLLAEIVELSHLRVREIMTPRVDALLLDLAQTGEDRRAVIQEAVRRRRSYLPVIRADADQVVGMARVKDLLCEPQIDLEQSLQPACFVPEMGGVLQMLHTLRESGAAHAIVVDEWGGTAGVVSLELLFEELFGDLRVEGEGIDRAVIPLGEGRYRVAGDLSIRDWNDMLGVAVVPNAFETVGGLVLALLDRLPRVGDRVRLGGGLIGEVSEVRARRVFAVDLFVEDGAGGLP